MLLTAKQRCFVATGNHGRVSHETFALSALMILTDFSGWICGKKMRKTT